jgi:hypothetical protein
MKQLFLLLLISLLAACAKAPRQSAMVRDTLCVPIGIDGAPMTLCVDNIEESPYFLQYNRYRLEIASGSPGVVLGGGFRTHDLLVSPTRRFMVEVEDAGEGHGIFSVVDLDDVRAGAEPGRCGWTEAYPGGFYDLSWEGEVLLFKTEVDLFADQAQGNGTFEEPGFVYTYRMYPEEKCRLEMFGMPVPFSP